ncbi:MAG: tetratricopeptide repeat protein [Kiloniellales bacterium]
MFALCLVCFLGAPAAADQTDPRLEDLFARLQSASDVASARDIEVIIWNLWTTHPDDAVNTLMEQGIGEMSQRNFPAALGTFEKVIEQAPEFAEGWNKRATIHWLMGNFERSLEDIDRTLALEPRHFGALSGQGLVYSELEEWERALAAFESALEVNPQMTGPQTNAEFIREMILGRDI